jgi:hypothetical protein
MKKNYFTILLVTLLFSTSLFGQITNTATFNVDMTKMIAGGFNPSVDSIKVVGLVWESFGAKLDVSSTGILVPSASDPKIYSTKMIIDCGTAQVGDSLRWKLYVWPSDKIKTGSWEPFTGYDGRPYIVKENNAVVNLDPVVPNFQYTVSGLGPQNTFHIMADLTDILGTGEGYFDPTLDVLSVDGFSWDGVGFIVSGSKKMVQNPFLPGVIYETTLVIELDTAHAVGDSLRWKFVASPSDRWSNGGYENGVGRYTVSQTSGSTVEIGPFKPDLVPNFTLKKDSKVLFQIDMNHNATSRFDSSAIPINLIECMTVRGSHKVLGAWSGHWVQADTVTPGVPALNDSGRDGDKVAGDHIWSKIVTFPAGGIGGQTSYKYGVYYPGCEAICTDPGYYMDGFGSTGGDLTCPILERDNVYEIKDIWPNHKGVVSVRQLGNQIPDKFEMAQNYPNPFNPTTTITYTLNKNSNVRLNVYNVLGERVMELINDFQNAGNYEIKFDGSSLSSGVYFYSLSNGSTTVTKKMMLLK